MQNILISRKLPVAFTLLAVLASIIIGAVAYVKSATSLDAAFESKLAGMAASREAALVSYLGTLREDLRVQSDNPRMMEALESFKAGWTALGADQLTVLQKAYITDNPNKTGEKHKLDAAPAPNAYNLAHAKYHPWIRKFLDERGYYDIFLFSPEGDVVYTVFKELDYATNVLSGQWKDTDLGNAFRQARDAKPNQELFFDFKPYAPSNNAPAAFLSIPVHDSANKLLGVLAFQMPIERLNKVMQVSEGLGKTGETYLVGADLLMRSDSRFSKDSTILKTKVDTAQAREGVAGKKG
jgi:methyl-accepting chemotaxis protein